MAISINEWGENLLRDLRRLQGWCETLQGSHTDLAVQIAKVIARVEALEKLEERFESKFETCKEKSQARSSEQDKCIGQVENKLTEIQAKQVIIYSVISAVVGIAVSVLTTWITSKIVGK